MMRERPILFSGPMVRALLAGTKTQTRRVVKGEALTWLEGPNAFTPEFVADPGNLHSPYGYAGDRLWVRESIRLVERWNDGGENDRAASVYIADGTPTVADAWPWKNDALPSIHCPRGLSRILLEVTEVRVQCLQDISADDMRAESVTCGLDYPGMTHCHCMPCVSLRENWVKLWDGINGKRAPWASNPWVWVVSFKRVEADHG